MQRYNKEFRDDVLGFLLRYPCRSVPRVSGVRTCFCCGLMNTRWPNLISALAVQVSNWCVI